MENQQYKVDRNPEISRHKVVPKGLQEIEYLYKMGRNGWILVQVMVLEEESIYYWRRPV
jgi:hypothetical protein